MQKLIETEDGCLWIENEVNHLLSGIFIHWDIYTWSPSKVKYYKQLWNECIVGKLMNKFGKVYAIPPSEHEEKLIKMFGMKYTGLTFQGNKLYTYEDAL